MVSPYISPGTFNGKPPSQLLDDFQQGFNDWNSGPVGGGNWTLVNGGSLDITFDVDVFDPEAQIRKANQFRGGAGIVVSLSNYTGKLEDGAPGPAANDFWWMQSVYVNYGAGAGAAADNPNDTPATPATPKDTLDVWSLSNGGSTSNCIAVPLNNQPSPAGKGFCDPIYPFQNAANASGILGFGDEPLGQWRVPASFRGIALLTTVNTSTRTITAYNGVDYGFDLTVVTPEPSSVIFIGAGTVLLVLVRRRGARRGV